MMDGNPNQQSQERPSQSSITSEPTRPAATQEKAESGYWCYHEKVIYVATYKLSERGRYQRLLLKVLRPGGFVISLLRSFRARATSNAQATIVEPRLVDSWIPSPYPSPLPHAGLHDSRMPIRIIRSSLVPPFLVCLLVALAPTSPSRQWDIVLTTLQSFVEPSQVGQQLHGAKAGIGTSLCLPTFEQQSNEPSRHCM